MEQGSQRVAAFAALGSRGDVQPLAAVVQRLRAGPGWKCILVTHHEHGSWLRFGLPASAVEFVSFGHMSGDCPEHHAEVCRVLLRGLSRMIVSTPKKLLGGAVVVHNLFALEAWHLARALAIGSVAITPFVPGSPPHAISSELEEAFQGEPPSAVRHWMWPLLIDRWEPLRWKLSLPPSESLFDLEVPPLFYSFSAHLSPLPHHLPGETVGFLQAAWRRNLGECELSKAISTASSSLPRREKVFLILTSADVMEDEELASIVRSFEALALARSDIDPVIVGKAACLFATVSAIAIKDVALDVALAHCSTAVHCGGAGTLCACLVAACPQVIIPSHFDQQSNADLLEWKGLAEHVVLRPACEGFAAEVRAKMERALASTVSAVWSHTVARESDYGLNTVAAAMRDEADKCDAASLHGAVLRVRECLENGEDVTGG